MKDPALNAIEEITRHNLKVLEKPRNGDDSDARTQTPSQPAKRSQADDLVELAEKASLFCSPDGTAYADFSVNGHRETARVSGRGFREWLQHLHWKKTGKAARPDALRAASGTIEAKAKHESREVHEVLGMR